MIEVGPVAAYQEPPDLRLVPELVAAAPVEAKAFLDFNTAAERADGAIPAKYRELIAIGVALTTQCAYCLDVHTRRALGAGATREELAETAFITAALRAGAALGHGLLVQKIAAAQDRTERVRTEAARDPNQA
jgi:AhpD family alkylhydroperoxidase